MSRRTLTLIFDDSPSLLGTTSLIEKRPKKTHTCTLNNSLQAGSSLGPVQASGLHHLLTAGSCGIAIHT